jgi:transposase
VVSGGDKPHSPSGCIHIELQGRALISIESGADPALLRTILESLRK